MAGVGSYIFLKQIQPIPYSDEVIGGDVLCTLTGWGYTTFIRFGRPPNDLQRINLMTVTNSECSQDGQSVDDTGICTLARFGKGACGVLWSSIG